MPVEVHESGVTYSGPDGVALYRLITLKAALKMQATTLQPLTMTRISAVACAKRLGFKGRTAASLLADLLSKHPELR